MTTDSITTNTTNQDYWTNIPDGELLAFYYDNQKLAAHFTALLGRSEQELIRRMTERHATAIPNETFICEMETRDTYSQVGFTPLKEIFYAEDLEKCLVWSHEETVQVPDKWNTQQVKAAARKYGAEALEVVKSARIPGAPKLRFGFKVPVS